MPKNWYQEALVAIGTTGRRPTIRNMLNEISGKTTDQKLRTLVEATIAAFDATSTDPSHTPIKLMNCVRDIPIERYCLDQVAADET